MNTLRQQEQALQQQRRAHMAARLHPGQAGYERWYTEYWRIIDALLDVQRCIRLGRWS